MNPGPQSPHLFLSQSTGTTLFPSPCGRLWPDAVAHGHTFMVMYMEKYREGRLRMMNRGGILGSMEPASWRQGCDSEVLPVGLPT